MDTRTRARSRDNTASHTTRRRPNRKSPAQTEGVDTTSLRELRRTAADPCSPRYLVHAVLQGELRAGCQPHRHQDQSDQHEAALPFSSAFCSRDLLGWGRRGHRSSTSASTTTSMRSWTRGTSMHLEQVALRLDVVEVARSA